MRAARAGYSEMVSLLCDRGADVDAQTYNVSVCMRVACYLVCMYVVCFRF